MTTPKPTRQLTDAERAERRRELDDIKRELHDIKASLLPSVREAIEELRPSQSELYAKAASGRVRRP